MSKQFRVYVRDDDGKFKKWEGQFNVDFSETDFAGCTLWLPPSECRYPSAVLFRDIKDLNNIKQDCVVCKMVTDELCEGDYTQSLSGTIWSLAWCQEKAGFYITDVHDDTYCQLISEQDELDEIVGHQLTHRIDKKGKVEKR